MNRNEQRTFVQEMCETIEGEVISLIDAEKMPAEFDGHEIRVLLSEKFKEAARLSCLRLHPHSSRNKAYREWRATRGGA